MFYASILFCWIHLSGPQCLVAIDEYGPYKTVAECHERVEKMSSVILKQVPFADIRGKKCERKGRET